MTSSTLPSEELWARFRFSVIGHLLASPPQEGQLQSELQKLTDHPWQHPLTGEALCLGFSTIESWYYAAKNAKADPMRELSRKIRKDKGTSRVLTSPLKALVNQQYRDHPTWSYLLHAQNLEALMEKRPELGRVPSYTTVRRFMKKQGLFKQKRKKKGQRNRLPDPFEKREVRSFEVEQVHGLWHLDFHECSRAIVLSDGSLVKPQLLGILDDHSRLCCHAQWYLHESAENLVHGLNQAILKRGLPRALLSDNGSAMLAGETTQGLSRLGIVHRTTLAYSPHQNAKQEAFWTPIEGRLMAMLECVEDLTLMFLNRATQAWVEMEYQRSTHDEIGTSPLNRYTQAPSVGRESPSYAVLKQYFAIQVRRTQRRSDGTFLLDGVRFELPARYHHLDKIAVRYARWDLGYVHLVDPQGSLLLCRLWPLDKAKNASMPRRRLDEKPAEQEHNRNTNGGEIESGIAPLLQKYLDALDQTGLPPAYLPKDETTNEPEDLA